MHTAHQEVLALGGNDAPECSLVHEAVQQCLAAHVDTVQQFAQCPYVEAYTDGSAPIVNPGGPAGFSAVMLGWHTVPPHDTSPHARLDLAGFIPARNAEHGAGDLRAVIAGRRLGAARWDGQEVRARISKYRRVPILALEDPTIGCILLEEPFFFPRELWIPAPTDFKLNTVQGKTYDLSTAEGRALYQQVGERLQAAVPQEQPAVAAVAAGARFGNPVLVAPRLGQGSFRVLVGEAYNRRCAVTGERTLPVLEAAHIKPYAVGGEHRLDNGLFLRSDLHTLFDYGYISVDPDKHRLLVSKRIREEFENGRHYYALDGSPLAVPVDRLSLPARENLLYHAQTVYRG